MRNLTAMRLALAYGAFVIYGSLVPLQFQPVPLDEAWQRFLQLPYLNLGLEARADWVANGVLYAPLTFFIARTAARGGVGRAAALLSAIGLGCGLAVAMEYIQLYFPARTASLNDIIAECIGSVVGATAASTLAGWLRRMGAAWRGGGARLRPRLLELYTVAYLLLCFFPYDLLLSAAEVQHKWAAHQWGWWLAPHERGAFLVAAQLLVEAALVLPIVGLPVLQSDRHAAAGRIAAVTRAAGLGLLLGAFIEVGQFFVASGVCQGASVLSRMLGMGAGALALPWMQTAGLQGLRAALRPWTWPLGAAYALVLAAANGAFNASFHGLDGAAAAWRAVHLLPLYYHYYTTEALAVFSLGTVALAYSPVALLGWLRSWSGATVAAVAAGLALCVEAGKLFMASGHADPTNVLIAAASSVMAHALLAIAQRPAALEAGPTTVGAARAWPWRNVGLLALLPVLLWSATFPAFALPLTVLLAVAAALVWCWPVLALALIPAALPVLDAAPWSGRFFVDEFDLLQAACMAVAFSRLAPVATTPSRRQRWMTWPWWLLAASLVFSTARGLADAAWPDANSFSSYGSPYNALRIVKGAVWALLFAALWRRLALFGERRARWFCSGVLCGLAYVLLVVLWERMSVVGLWDFNANFRVTGPFSAMHKGGAYIECFLVVAAAFALQAALQRCGVWIGRVVAVLLLAATCYATMVTYSRNGYAALGVVAIASLGVAALHRVRSPTAWRREGVVGVAVLAMLAAVAWPIAGGGYARQRLAQSGGDLSVRQAHWADGLALRDSGAPTLWLGMGLGRFPRAHYWRSPEPVHAASYGLVRDGGQAALRLGQGAPLYIEQIVARPDFGELTVRLDFRGPPGQLPPGVFLCEKWTLTAISCASAMAPPAVSAAAGGWQRLTVNLDASKLLMRRMPWRAPWKLSLMTPQQGAVDVARVQLLTAFGDDLLVNGDFSHGMDRWFFATDVDPPWHLHSLPVAVLFDQGWLGVGAWSLLFIVAALGATQLVWRHAAQVPAAMPAAMGFLASGLLNTLIDAPRFLWLLLVLLWLALQERAQPGGGLSLKQQIFSPCSR